MMNVDKMKGAEVKLELKARNVEFDEAAKVADLKELLKGVLAEEVENNPEPVPQYALRVMRAAIIGAHNAGNRHAITSDEAYMAGVSAAGFQNWVAWVSSLRSVVVDYVKLKHQSHNDLFEEQKTKSELELKKAYSAIFPVWRTIIKVGDEPEFHRHFFVREDDISSLIGYAETFINVADCGTQMAIKGELIFRKLVESLIGFRMTGNAIITDTDRDIIKKYESALNTIDVSNKRLNGYDNNEGHVPGIIENIASATKKRDKMVEKLNNANVDESLAKEILVSYELAITDLEKQKKQAEGAIKKAEKDIADNKWEEHVNNVKATLAGIE